MEMVRVELPAALIAAAGLEGADVSPETARLLALELFREERVSLGRAAELCSTPLAVFMDFAAKHGVPPLRHNFQDLEEERCAADTMNV